VFHVKVHAELVLEPLLQLAHLASEAITLPQVLAPEIVVLVVLNALALLSAQPVPLASL